MKELHRMKLDFRKMIADTRTLERLILAVGILLVVAVIGFGVYYYIDRFHTDKQTTMDLSIQQAEQELAKDPQNSEKRLELANIYLINSRYQDARRLAQDVLLVEPDNQQSWLILGVSLALDGKPDEAIEPLQKYYDANKDSEMPGLNRTLHTAAYYLGDSYYRTGQLEKAVEPLENAVIWSKTDADAMYKLGIVYSATERYDDALAMFTYATAFVPDYKEAYQGMVEVFTKINEPDYLNYANGMVAYTEKDYNKAIELLLKAAEAKPDFAPAFAGLGLAYEAVKDLQKSKDAYTAALKLDQSNLTAQQGLQRVDILINQK
jgi:tetratricopeptide (TPR) repeat protein